MPSPGLGSTTRAAELTSTWLARLRWLFWLAVKSSKVVLQLDASLESTPCKFDVQTLSVCRTCRPPALEDSRATHLYWRQFFLRFPFEVTLKRTVKLF